MSTKIISKTNLFSISVLCKYYNKRSKNKEKVNVAAPPRMAFNFIFRISLHQNIFRFLPIFFQKDSHLIG